MPLKYLSSKRKTVLCFGDGRRNTRYDSWRGPQQGDCKVVGGALWSGYTEFFLKKIPEEVSYMVRRGSDEVREEDIPEDQWEQWRVAEKQLVL